MSLQRLEIRHLESRAKAEAILDIGGSAGWVNSSSRGLWGGDAVLLSTGAAVGGFETLRFGKPPNPDTPLRGMQQAEL
jgi:hypothetical protein